jgi:hypothetical protein
VIVNAVEERCGRLKTEAGAQVTTCDEVFGIALNSTIFKAGRDGLPAAAIEADAAASQRRAAFGRDVDDAGRVQAILRRQRAGEQLQVADEGALKNLGEAGYAVGQQNAVDAILNVAVLIADVEIALARLVLVDARKLKNEVAELNGVSLWEALDIPLTELIGAGASLRQEDSVASLVEILGLLDDLTIGRGLGLFLDLLRGRRGGGGGLVGHDLRRSHTRPRAFLPR